MMTSRINGRLECSLNAPLNFERDDLGFCVICCSQLEGGRRDLDNDNGNSSLLSKNLAVIFVLRKLLQVPGSELEENLREYGDPVNWIRLCEQCSQLTRQAEDLHWKILRIEEELRSIQGLIVERVNSSSLSSPSSRMNTKRVWKRTSEFAVKCEPLIVSPFTEGDKLAECLLSHQNHEPLSQDIKLEVEAEDERTVEDDWSQEYGDGESRADKEMEVKLETTDNYQEASSRSGRKRRNQKMIRINGKLKCRYCDKLFGAMSTCLLHEKEKHPRIPGQFPCDICGKPWNSRDYLRDHRRSAHGITPDGNRVSRVPITIKSNDFKGNSRVSKRSFGLSSSVSMRKRRNQKMIRVNGKLKCRYCDKLFGAMSTCLLHEKEKHPAIPGQFVCNICGKPWNSRDYLRDHRRSVHGINPNGIPVSSKKKRKEGINLKNGDEATKDIKLKKIKTNRSSGTGLRRVGRNARKVERVNGKLKCRYCDQLFGAMSTCLLHEKEKHARIPGQFVCDICGKPWNSRDYLRDHRRSVHGIKPDGSLVISKKKPINKLEDGAEKEIKLKKASSGASDGLGTKRKIGRKKTTKMEWVDGKWKCGYCGQTFGARSSCYLHEREKHAENVGQFICDICGKTWNSRDYLRDHRRSTHGINPDGSKAEKRNEKRKKKGKAEEIKCRHCDKVFCTLRNCDLHEKEKHADNPEGQGQFICDICGKAWNTLEFLRKHRCKHKTNTNEIPTIPQKKQD